MIRALRFLSVLLVLASSLAQATTFEQVNTTSPQNLANKSLIAPAISNPVLSGTSSGTYTLGGTVTISSPTITTPTISSPVLSGSSSGTYTLAGTVTVTSPTITGPTITGTVAGGASYTSPSLTGTVGGSASYTTPTLASPILTTPKQLHADVVSVDNYGSFAAAISAIGSSVKTLWVPSAQTIGQSLTCPSNVTLFVNGSGALNPSSTYTLTVNCPIVAAPGSQIFGGAGTVSFGNAVNPIVHAGWFGTTMTNLQAAMDSLASGQTLLIPGAYTGTGLSLTNKSNVRITGNGSLTLSAAGSTAMAINLVGTLSNIEIDSLRIIGEGNAAYSQVGVGSNSGQTISDVSIHDLKVSAINVCISTNAYPTGTYVRAKVFNNYCSAPLGTSSGQGYGIHTSGATNSTYRNNHVDADQRHCVYHASGTNANNRIINNLCTNHRSAVASASVLAAIVVARSSGVLVEGNVVRDFYDGAVEISQEESTSLNASDIQLTNNQFFGRKNNVYTVSIGQQAIPTSYRTSNVLVQGNQFLKDWSVGGGNEDIIVNNGSEITIQGNVHRHTAVGGTDRFTGMCNVSYASSVTDCTYTYVLNNSFLADGSVLTDTRAVNYDSPSPTNTSNHWMINNRLKNIAIPAYFVAARTNPNLLWNGEMPARDGVYTAAATTPSVAGIDFLSITNSGATSITNLTNGESKQLVTLFFNDANTTITNNATIKLAGAVNFVSTANDTLTLRNLSGVWYEVSRSVN